jgi:predicted transcriptional regulator
MNKYIVSGSRKAHTRHLLALLIFSALFAAAFLSAASDSAEAIHLFTPTKDVASQTSLDVVVTYESLHAKSGDTLTFFVKVTESGCPVNQSQVNFTTDSPWVCSFYYENEGLTDADGSAVVLMTVHSDTLTVVNITARAYFETYVPGYYEIEEISIEPRPIISYTDRIQYLSLTTIITIIIIGSTEVGRYALMNLFFLPLYSRFKKDEMLDHFVRGQIYGYIISHPGEHYNHIKSKLEVTNGTLSHHLRALEFQGYIKSQRDGTYKRFYPTDMKIPRTKGIKLSDLQLCIVDAIRQSPGISQKEIATMEGISQQSVSYNLSVLERMGILNSYREGIRKSYFISSES